MSQNSFERFPAKRVFLEDLNEGTWNTTNNYLNTKYGGIKRARICGIVLKIREIIEETDEDSIVVENESNSRITYLIDDGTGRIRGTLWLNNKSVHNQIKEGEIVDAIGLIRTYNNQKQITIESIREVLDYNFQTYHMTEILETRKFGEKFEIDHEEGDSFDNLTMEFPDEILMDEEEVDEDEGDVIEEEKISPKKVVNDNSDAFNNLDLEDKIIDYISQNDTGDGVSIKAIADGLSMNTTDLDKILEKLIQDIKIYRTQPNYYSPY